MHIKGSDVISQSDGHLNGNFSISSENQNDSQWMTSLETVNHNTYSLDKSNEDDSRSIVNCGAIDYSLQNIDDVLTINNSQTDEDLDLETIKDCIRSLEPSLVGRTSPTVCDYSTDEGLFEYEDGDKSSSTDDSQQQDDEAIFDETDSDESYHEPLPRGIYNPNYPGFQHLAYTLRGFCVESPHEEYNNNEDDLDQYPNLERDLSPVNNENQVRVHSPAANKADDFQCDLVTLQREIYEFIQKPMSDSLTSIDEGIDCVMKYIEQDQQDEMMSTKEMETKDEIKDAIDSMEIKANDAYMSDAREIIRPNEKTNLVVNTTDIPKTPPDTLKIIDNNQNMDLNCNELSLNEKDNKFNKDDNIEDNKEKNVGLDSQSKNFSIENIKKEEKHTKLSKENTKSNKRNKKRNDGFDVYNIETAMPSIDMEAIENHLRAAREEERRRRNDREEIRRRLAMGVDHGDYYQASNRPGRKPSLQSRLQSGMNLQICFMNETASDNESLSESENNELNDNISNKKSISELNGKNKNDIGSSHIFKTKKVGLIRPTSLALRDTSKPAVIGKITSKADFFECQARLQAEARMALAQAKEMARIQMEIERQNLETSPITEMLRYSLQKAGVDLLGDRRRVSRQMLTDMNVTQLQVIVNELHTQIEHLNEDLVQLLIARDELHMSQDSMLVDIEDLTRYLSAREVNTRPKDFEDKPNMDAAMGNNNTSSASFSAFTTLLQK